MINAETEDEEQNAIAERDRIREGRIKDDSIFEPYYTEMKQMIHDETKAHGIEYFIEDEEEDEDIADKSTVWYNTIGRWQAVTTAQMHRVRRATGVKRESGENPERARHCIGESAADMSLARTAGKALWDDEPKPGDLPCAAEALGHAQKTRRLPHEEDTCTDPDPVVHPDQRRAGRADPGSRW